MMCGPDCLAYLFPPANAAEIARACGTDDSGTRLGAMAQWVETQGCVAAVREYLTWDELRAHALAQHVIVPWWSIFDEDGKRANAGDGHYSVVLGVNAFFIALYDPDIGGVRNLPRAPKTDAPPVSKLSALLAQSVSPLLDERPAGAQSIREMAAEHNVSIDVIRRQLEEYRAAGVKLRHARVKLPKGGYTIMYWVE